MKIYIDTQDNFRCYPSDGSGTLLPYEPGRNTHVNEEFFSGKSDEFIKGYQCVPDGHTWTRADGETFTGEMIAPLRDYNELYIAQLEYELADADAALREVGVPNGI